MKSLLVFIGAIAFVISLTLTANAATLVVADFDAGEKPNNIGGDFGAWNKDEEDDTQGCFDSFDSDIKHGNKGYSMKLEYDVDSPNPAYNGFWMKLQNQNITAYDKLSFWVKGDEVAGFSPKIKLELKNSKGELGRYTLSNVTKDWQQVTVPLNQFRGLTDLTSMTEFVIVFDDITCKPKKVGTIYIDDVAFVK